MKKNKKKSTVEKKAFFFLCFFFNCCHWFFVLFFLSRTERKVEKSVWEWVLKCFLKKKKRICFSFHFFIIKWIYNKKSLSVWINQQNKFFFFLPQYHHLQLQHTTFSFKLNNPIIKKIINTHFFSFFLFFFVLFLQLSPSSFNQKTNKSKKDHKSEHMDMMLDFFLKTKRNIWSYFNPKKCYNCKCSLSSPLCAL